MRSFINHSLKRVMQQQLI